MTDRGRPSRLTRAEVTVRPRRFRVRTGEIPLVAALDQLPKTIPGMLRVTAVEPRLITCRRRRRAAMATEAVGAHRRVFQEIPDRAVPLAAIEALSHTKRIPCLPACR